MSGGYDTPPEYDSSEEQTPYKPILRTLSTSSVEEVKLDKVYDINYIRFDNVFDEAVGEEETVKGLKSLNNIHFEREEDRISSTIKDVFCPLKDSSNVITLKLKDCSEFTHILYLPLDCRIKNIDELDFSKFKDLWRETFEEMITDMENTDQGSLDIIVLKSWLRCYTNVSLVKYDSSNNDSDIDPQSFASIVNLEKLHTGGGARRKLFFIF